MFSVSSCIVLILIKSEILCLAKPNVEVQDIVENNVAELPYVVGLKLTLCGTPFCSGTIINTEWILTAAQCVYDKQPTELYVQYGVIRSSSNETIYANVTQIIVHNDFKKEGSINNIAILELKNPLQDGTFVKPVELPHSDLIVPAGSLAEHLKWISEENDMKTLKDLQKIQLVTSDECPKNFILYDLETVTYKMSNVCGKRPVYKSPVCLGHLGAPLMVDGLQVGIFSMGQPNCKYDKNPASYTELAHYVNWIFRSINLNLFMKFLILTPSNPTCTLTINSKNIPLFGCYYPEHFAKAK